MRSLKTSNLPIIVEDLDKIKKGTDMHMTKINTWQFLLQNKKKQCIKSSKRHKYICMNKFITFLHNWSKIKVNYRQKSKLKLKVK